MKNISNRELKIKRAIREGAVGVMPNGEIVDILIYPEAYPLSREGMKDILQRFKFHYWAEDEKIIVEKNLLNY